jgi:hypothetical protein
MGSAARSSNCCASTKWAPAYVKPMASRGYGDVGVNGQKNPIEVYIACWEWGKRRNGRRSEPLLLPGSASSKLCMPVLYFRQRKNAEGPVSGSCRMIAYTGRVVSPWLPIRNPVASTQ